MTNFEWWGRLARDGYFLCQLCFSERLVFEAWTDADGAAWDICRECQRHEADVKAWAEARTSPLARPEAAE